MLQSEAPMFSSQMLDPSADQPLYEQIYDLLRAAIADGGFPLGALLPAEQDLVGQLKVSRITVKRAMNELAAAGFVRRQRGRGTVVVHDVSAPILKGRIDTMMEGLIKMGEATDVALVELQMVPASPSVAKNLKLPRGSKVQRIVRVRSLDNHPFSHLVTHVPAKIAGTYSAEALKTAALIDLLRQAGHAPVEAEQSISAIAATSEIAAHLGIASGSAILRVHRIMRDANQTPVQDITIHYRADRFEYHMRFTRGDDAGIEDWSSS